MRRFVERRGFSLGVKNDRVRLVGEMIYRCGYQGVSV